MGGRPDVSVITPAFDAAAYLPRAIASLLAQDGVDWEWVLVDDGSSDDPGELAAALLPAGRWTLVRHETNRGLGAACNSGLAVARGRYVAYLPADDVFFADHLSHLVRALDADPSAVAAHSGVLVDGTAHETASASGLQPVQVVHRAGAARWRERTEFESDDLEPTVWTDLRVRGAVLATHRVTCGWTQHPAQRHRTFSAATDGGLNAFRARYGAPGYLRFRPRDADPVDERLLYGVAEPASEPTAGAFDVLLVGELAYNADRVVDLAALDVRLRGLWIDDPLGFMTVGPLPFGGVVDVPRRAWRDAVRRDPPDVVYCLLNWRTVPLALAVADALPGVPLVWHFKEAPQRCLARGQWPQLAELWQRADAVLVCSDEERNWLLAALPGRRDATTVSVMDGDLPRSRWFPDVPDERAPTSGQSAAVHSVCVGRPVGLTADLLAHLARADVHVHFHGLPPPAVAGWWPAARRAAPHHVHRHPAVPPARWADALGGYDAGWLHAVAPDNCGELARASWNDLNVPARLPTLAAAGLPLIAPDPGGQVSAVGRLVRSTAAGLLYRDNCDLIDQLRDAAGLHAARKAMAGARSRFAFGSEVGRLADLLRRLAAGGEG